LSFERKTAKYLSSCQYILAGKKVCSSRCRDADACHNRSKLKGGISGVAIQPGSFREHCTNATKLVSIGVKAGVYSEDWIFCTAPVSGQWLLTHM
jgi:hypothetical protein